MADQTETEDMATSKDAGSEPSSGISLSTTEIVHWEKVAPGVLTMWQQYARQRRSDEAIAELDRLLMETLPD